MEIVWKWQINLHAGLESKILWLHPGLFVKEKEKKKTLKSEDELTSTKISNDFRLFLTEEKKIDLYHRSFK